MFTKVKFVLIEIVEGKGMIGEDSDDRFFLDEIVERTCYCVFWGFFGHCVSYLNGKGNGVIMAFWWGEVKS